MICTVFGLALLLGGWLMPAHLRAIESPVLKQAGRNTPTVTGHGLELVRAGQLGPAELLSRAALAERLPADDARDARALGRHRPEACQEGPVARRQAHGQHSLQLGDGFFGLGTGKPNRMPLRLQRRNQPLGLVHRTFPATGAVQGDAKSRITAADEENW